MESILSTTISIFGFIGVIGVLINYARSDKWSFLENKSENTMRYILYALAIFLAMNISLFLWILTSYMDDKPVFSNMKSVSILYLLMFIFLWMYKLLDKKVTVGNVYFVGISMLVGVALPDIVAIPQTIVVIYWVFMVSFIVLFVLRVIFRKKTENLMDIMEHFLRLVLVIAFFIASLITIISVSELISYFVLENTESETITFSFAIILFSGGLEIYYLVKLSIMKMIDVKSRKVFIPKGEQTRYIIESMWSDFMIMKSVYIINVNNELVETEEREIICSKASISEGRFEENRFLEISRNEKPLK